MLKNDILRAQKRKHGRGSQKSLDNPNAAGYQVQVKAEFKGDWFLCIEVIANRLGYSVKNEPENKTNTIFESPESKIKRYSEIKKTGLM